MWRRIWPLRARLLVVAVVAAAAAAALPGCGVGPHRTLNAAGIESQITAELVHQYQLVGVKISVRCPSGTPATKGQTFTCSASLDGQSLVVNGTVTGTGGRYTIQPAEAVIIVSHAVSVLQADIATQTHVPDTVNCGRSTVLIVAAGRTFSCTATVAGQARQATVMVSGLQGNEVSYSLAPPASGRGSTTPPQTLPASPGTSSPSQTLPGGD